MPVLPGLPGLPVCPSYPACPACPCCASCPVRDCQAVHLVPGHDGRVLTAAALARALTPAFVEILVPGEPRHALGIEVVEPGSGFLLDRGDLVVAVGFRNVEELLPLVDGARATAGILARRDVADQPTVRASCEAAGVPLLGVPEATSWSSLLRLVRRSVDAEAGAGQSTAATIHADLFEMADKLSTIIGSPVTIEDPTSRVLAYSTGQDDVDDARMSTIFARQVPREVRDRLRSLGVFRRLARSDEPFLVPAGDGLARGRYVVPVRAGGDWLGSVWAVVDEAVAAEHEAELRAAAEVVALYLLRLRAHGELHRQVQLDRVRSVLLGAGGEHPGWLGDGPWRVAALSGPVPLMAAEDRCELWSALARRHGWREPLLGDLADVVYVVLDAAGTGPGTWTWLAELVRGQARTNPLVRMAGGGPVTQVVDLGGSREQADEVARLTGADGPGGPGSGGPGGPGSDCPGGAGSDGPGSAGSAAPAGAAAADPVSSIESSWPAVVLARAATGLAGRPLLSPLAALIAQEGGDGGPLSRTLETVLDFWGEPQRAAHALGVHPNTIRYRLARIVGMCRADLDDPAQRLAIRLELAARHRPH